MNFLEETISAMESSGNLLEDISFIGSEVSGHSCTWDDFIQMADKDYDNGYGAPEVAQDLVIVFKNGTKMKRGEHDGSEW